MYIHVYIYNIHNVNHITSKTGNEDQDEGL